MCQLKEQQSIFHTSNWKTPIRLKELNYEIVEVLFMIREYLRSNTNLFDR